MQEPLGVLACGAHRERPVPNGANVGSPLAALLSNPALEPIQQPQGCDASWSASLGAGWFLRCAERRWFLQPTHAVKEPPGNLQPTVHSSETLVL